MFTYRTSITFVRFYPKLKRVEEFKLNFSVLNFTKIVSAVFESFRTNKRNDGQIFVLALWSGIGDRHIRKACVGKLFAIIVIWKL
jgi:hypothetical protein